MGRELYALGRWAPAMPIPADLERCTTVEAGPIRFVIEPRTIDVDLGKSEGLPKRDSIDGGGSLHVFGASDGLEHLRFDCFDEFPHYHYVHQTNQTNLVCRYDEIAGGDALAWTLARIRTRLPEMLEFAGASALAAETRDRLQDVVAGVDRVAVLMEQAGYQAVADKHVRSGEVDHRGDP